MTTNDSISNLPFDENYPTKKNSEWKQFWIMPSSWIYKFVISKYVCFDMVFKKNIQGLENKERRLRDGR